MARKMDDLGSELVAQIEQAWARKNLEDWQRKRMLVVRLIAQHRLDAKGIVEAARVSRVSVFNYRDKLEEGGRRPFEPRLGWRAQACALSRAWKVLKRFGGKLKASRKRHAKKTRPSRTRCGRSWPCIWPRWRERMRQGARFGCSTSTATGFLPVIRRICGKRGVRVHAPNDTKYRWGYLHEAMEVDRDNAAELLFTPAIDHDPTRLACARSPKQTRTPCMSSSRIRPASTFRPTTHAFLPT